MFWKMDMSVINVDVLLVNISNAENGWRGK